MVMLVPGVLAFAFGWFAFRSRVTGVYLSIITQALTYRAEARLLPQRFRLWRQQRPDRLQGHPRLQRAGGRDARGAVLDLGDRARVAFIVAKAIVTSKYGKALIAVRDAESRVRFLGYRVENYKLFVWVVSAVIAGVAGALYVPQVGIINPSEFDPGNSIEAVIWVAVGGRGTLVGAALGAVVVNFAKTYFTGALPRILAVRPRRAVHPRHAVPAQGHPGLARSLRGGSTKAPPAPLAERAAIAEEGGSAP